MRNYSIDKVKLLASFAVVFMHVVNYLPTTEYANYWTYDWYFPLLDLAVPLFFVFSGYFLSRKKTEQIPSYANKILVMLIAYNIVYILIKWPMDILSGLIQGRSGTDLIFSYFHTMSWSNVITGIFGSEHLWYLSALLFSSWILYYVNKNKLSSLTAFTIGITLFLLIFIPPINFLWDNLLLYGGFVKGYFYLSMGYYLAKSHFNYPNKVYYFVATIIMLVVIGSQVNNQFIYELLLALVVFNTVNILKKNPGHPSILSKFSHHSLSIYLLHIIFTGIFNAVRGFVPAINQLNPIIVVVPMILICIIGSVLVFPITEEYVHQPLVHIFNRQLRKYNISAKVK